MYRCLDCGSVFDESDVAIVEEYMGECHGAPAYEPWSACPFCKSTDIELFDPDEFYEDEILAVEED